MLPVAAPMANTVRRQEAAKPAIADVVGQREPAVPYAGWEQFNQPGGGVQHCRALRQLFLAIDIVEQLERAVVARMVPRGFAKQMQAR